MQADTLPSDDLHSAVASFGAAISAAEGTLRLSNWREEDWKQLFQHTSIRNVQAGNALIQAGESDRTLFFVLYGRLEVTLRSGDGITQGRLAVVGAGSVLGELAFFDGSPRSARAWAVDDCKVAAMTPDQYSAFEKSSPDLARQLIFALGRILATRLRLTNERISR